MKSMLASMAVVVTFCAAPALSAEFPKTGEAEYDTYYVDNVVAKIDGGAGTGSRRFARWRRQSPTRSSTLLVCASAACRFRPIGERRRCPDYRLADTTPAPPPPRPAASR